MTFEQLIRADLMNAVTTHVPAIELDGGGEPKDIQVVTRDREFDHDYSRKIKIHADHAPDAPPATMEILEATAMVRVPALLTVNTARDPRDLDALMESLLATDSVVWTWRGRSIRVGRMLLRTRAEDREAVMAETLTVNYEAPYFKSKSAPVIPNESWFDGWDFGV